MHEREFEGRTALVTGGARGIGRACCERLAATGAKVAVNYRSSGAAARETVERIEAAGGTAHLIQADVSSPEQVEKMVDDVASALGPVDLLVNNAGIFEQRAHGEMTLDHWQRTLDCNLTSAFLVTAAVKAGMVDRQFGRIVNVSSISALRARPTSIAYAVSKAGLIALTKSLADAVAGDNLRVNAVAPGLVETPILDGVEQSLLDRLIAATPMSRIGQPNEIAEIVLFLLSERSSFMTGQTVVASGGRVMLP